MNDLLSFDAELSDPHVRDGSPTGITAWAHLRPGKVDLRICQTGIEIDVLTDANGARAFAAALVGAADAIDAYAEHVSDNHEARAEDGRAGPVLGCAACEEKFPAYFAEMRAARAEYDRATPEERTSECSFCPEPLADHSEEARFRCSRGGRDDRVVIGITERVGA